MSKFLGNIHFWLYNKILLSEKTEEHIISWAKSKGLPAEEWNKENIEKYGPPTEGQPLEKVIDTSNIHGWLQERITSAELRQASLITSILNDTPALADELMNIYKQEGESAAREYHSKPDTPEGMFNALHDNILEGMPCDRVNEVLSSSDREFVWETTTCLHKPYWEQVKGDVSNF